MAARSTAGAASVFNRGTAWSVLVLLLDALIVGAIAYARTPVHLTPAPWSRSLPSAPPTFVASTDRTLVLVHAPEARGGAGTVVFVPLTEDPAQGAPRVATFAHGGIVLDRDPARGATGSPWAWNGRDLLFVARDGSPGVAPMHTVRLRPDDPRAAITVGPAFDGARPEVGVAHDGTFEVAFVTDATEGAGRVQRTAPVRDDGSLGELRTLAEAGEGPTPRAWRAGVLGAAEGARPPAVALPDGTVLSPPALRRARSRPYFSLAATPSPTPSAHVTAAFVQTESRGGTLLGGRYELRVHTGDLQIDALLGLRVPSPALTITDAHDASRRRVLPLDLEPRATELLALRRGPVTHIVDGRGVHLRLRGPSLSYEGPRVSRLAVLAGKLGVAQSLALCGSLAMAHLCALWAASSSRNGASSAKVTRLAGLLSVFFASSVFLVLWSLVSDSPLV